MTLEQCGRAAVLILTAAGLTVGAAASDDDAAPLYVVHNGKRIPTVIIPPTSSADGAARHALLEVVELELAEDAEADSRPGQSEAGEPDAGGDVSYRPRRHELRHYAGHPVSVLRRAGYDGYYERYYGSYLPPGYGRTIKELYRAERYARERERARRFNRRDMRQRQERILNNHERALRVGLEQLKSGEYARAVVALTMAAQLNQGDPACRIHLAQARMALGHYQEGGKTLRRALQLQPKLVYVGLNLPSYYSDPGEFDEHVDRLARWVKENRASGETYFLLGYMEFQREDFEAAYAAFRIAARAMPKESLIRTYLNITRPASP